MEKKILKETQQHGTKGFPVAIYQPVFEKQHSLLAPLHYHKEFELLIAVKNAVTVQIEEQVCTLAEGEGIFINSSLLHMITSKEEQEHEFIALVFDYTMLCHETDAIFSKYIYPLMNQAFSKPVCLTQEMCEIVRLICAEYEQAEYGYELIIKEKLFVILYELIKKISPADSLVQSSRSDIIKNVIDYIQENYSQSVSLQDIADHVHLSREYLCRIFHSVSNITPITYLNQYRIQKSALLLLTTDKSISDIAFSCGFHSSSYFNKLFLRDMGCTPKEYKKKIL